MAAYFKDETIRLLDIKASVNLNKFTQTQKNNFIKFLRYRSFAQTYKGVAEIAHRILTSNNVPVVYNKGPYVNLNERDYTPKMKEAFETDFALFLLQHTPGSQGSWAEDSILSVKRLIEASKFPSTSLYFMKGHFKNVAKVVQDPLPEDHPISQLIKQIESGEVTSIDLDWNH